ncbi:MAG: hypothetical protein C0402_05260 [Thermodesulfovibrio sp.]|nr:hypothetical protein [Thermodesulfovibrio sp.]
MRHKQCSKSSATIITNEDAAKLAIKETINKVGTAYEFHLVETASVSVVEFILGLHLPAAERNCFVKEIFETFDSALQKFEVR